MKVEFISKEQTESGLVRKVSACKCVSSSSMQAETT